MEKEKIEKIVRLYFSGCSVKEAIDIVSKNIKLEDAKISLGWKYQQLKLN